MRTNETRAIKILQVIVDRLKALVEAQNLEILRLREQVSKLEKDLLDQAIPDGIEDCFQVEDENNNTIESI